MAQTVLKCDVCWRMAKYALACDGACVHTCSEHAQQGHYSLGRLVSGEIVIYRIDLVLPSKISYEAMARAVGSALN